MIEVTSELAPTGAWKLEDAGDGIAFLVFDVPGEKLNVLSEAVLRDLERVLEALGRDTTLRGLIVIGGKEDTGTFIAGANVHEIRSITSASEASEKARLGQAVLGRFASLPAVTVAAIHGACLGGGTELALACDLRIATHHPKTRIGLPEVQLGILPGFGGSQRLPRLVGLSRALPIILTGKPQSVTAAARIGLVDRVVYPPLLREEALALAREAIEKGGKSYVLRRSKEPWYLRLLESLPIGRSFLRNRATQDVLRRAGPHYPAPIKAIQAAVEGYGKPIEKGLELEARLVGELAASDVAKNLIDLFLSSEAARRREGGEESRDSCPAAGERVGLLGAGVMGGGLAALLARKGFRVRLKDIAHESIQAALAKAADLYNGRVRRRRMTPGEKANALASITATLDYSGFSRINFVIEAVVENLDVKKAVFREIEGAVGEDAILASNTSSLSISEMQKDLRRPERLVGLHFFNPVDRMLLVEVIRGERSSDEAVRAAENFARRLDKIPVRVGDGPGFLVNRLLGPYLNESVRLFEEGFSPVEIDQSMRHFGMPMGPFELLDEIGLDVAAKVSQVLYKAFGERARPPEFLEKILADPELRGKKTGKGFYVYRRKGKKRPNPVVLRMGGKTAKDFRPADPELWIRRLIYPVIDEAARALEDGIASSPTQVDLAMVLGTGFAPFRGGPLRYADATGPTRIVSALRDLREPRLAPSTYLVELADQGRGFYRDSRDKTRSEVASDTLERARG